MKYRQKTKIILGMDLLIPVLVVAQVILVHLAKIVTVNAVTATDGARGGRTEAAGLKGKEMAAGEDYN